MTVSPLRPALLLALAAFLAAAALLPAQAHAGRGMEIAIQDDPVFVGESYFDRERAFQHARELGVTRIRANLSWARAMPIRQARSRRKPATINYVWGQWDALIDNAARYGIRVHMSIAGPAPAFATRNRRIGNKQPNPVLFGQFAAAAAQHFAGRVDRYSVWNEPNWHSWLTPLRTAPAQYRALYQRAYTALKQQDRSAQVLIGETAPYERRGMSIAPLAFLRAVTCVNKRYRRTRSCPRLKADGFAHHPYDFLHSPRFKYPGADNVTIGTLPRLTRALDRLSRAGVLRSTRGGRLPVHLTEYGYFASGRRKLSSRKRSRYLRDAFTIALRNGRVRSHLQYLLVSPPRGSDWAFFDTALLNSRGRRQPQYNALRSWYRSNRGKVRRTGGPLRLPPARR